MEGNTGNFPRLRRAAEVQPLSEIVEEGRVLLQRAMKRHLLSDVRIGVFLERGPGFHGNLGLARNREAGHPLEAFTVSFPDRPGEDESGVAQATAERFGATFNQCQITDSTALRWMADALARIDQPSMDGFNTYVVARAAREQGIVVALSGLGGDEIFGGYNLFRRVPRTYDFMSCFNPLPSQCVSVRLLATAFISQVARQGGEIVAAIPD